MDEPTTPAELTGNPETGESARGDLPTWGVLAAAIVIYAALTVALTYPQVTSMRDRVRSGPDGQALNDALQNVWILAWHAQALRQWPERFYDTNVYFPRTNTLAYCPPLLGYIPLACPIIWLSGNPVLGYNVCLLMTFVLCAVSMFLLVFSLTRSVTAAGIAGFAFAFVPLRFRYYGQLSIPSAEWMVLALWCLHRYVRQRRLRDAWGMLGFTFLQGLFCGYYLVFFCTLLPVAWAVYAALDRGLRSRRSAALALLFFPCLLALLLPVYWPYVAHNRAMGYGRSLEDNIRYSADVLSYLSAPESSRAYGRWLRPVANPETQAFAGAALLALGCIGAVASLRSRDAGTRRAVVMYLVWGGASVALSLGPVVQVAGHRLCVGPYWLLHRFVPVYAGLRVPGRFAMLAMVALCVCAGYGVAAVRRWPRRGLRRAVLAAGVVVLGADSLHVPLPLAKVPLEAELPEVYRWLKSQPAHTAVVEIPLDLGDHDFDYLYASTYHWRRLVNGVSGYYPPENVAKYLTFRRGLSFPSCPRLLADLGVDYLIVHGGRMPVRVDKLVIPEGLELCRRFGDDRVYRVMRPDLPKVEARPNQRWEEIPRSRWKAYTNAPSSPPERVLDGRPETVWRTAVEPRGGMRFHVDLAGVHSVGKVRFEFGLAGNEFPRYFTLSVSADGRGWQTVADEADMPRFWADIYRSALCSPKNPSLEVTFTPRPCRYIAIELVRRPAYSGWAWCFAEVRAYSPAARPAAD